MRNFKNIFSYTCVVIMLLSFASCTPVDKDYGVSSEVVIKSDEVLDTAEHETQPIMSSDRVMSKYFDISLFDEENYADIYLGKKFEIESRFAGDTFEVPTTIKKMNELGWKLSIGNAYDENSLVFSYETIETVMENESGVTVKAWFYNSSRSSKKLVECNIVKFLITNDFYTNMESYNEFNINGITNSMAVTDVIDTLGTPSHFYEVSDTCYYLDYFITKKDRRNGITVYINPVEDNIISIEFSYYK